MHETFNAIKVFVLLGFVFLPGLFVAGGLIQVFLLKVVPALPRKVLYFVGGGNGFATDTKHSRINGDLTGLAEFG